MGGKSFVFAGGVCAAVLFAMPAAHATGIVTANPDTVHTTVNTPVNFDPTANDTHTAGATFSKIEIESDPSHGTATINADGKTIHYVPDAGYTGPDAMEYNVFFCQDVQNVAASVQDCNEDTGDISITVDPAPATTTTSTVTIASQGTTAPSTSTTTTVAAAAAATSQLPRTGSTNGPLLTLGFFALAGGVALTASMRRRATR